MSKSKRMEVNTTAEGLAQCIICSIGVDAVKGRSTDQLADDIKRHYSVKEVELAEQAAIIASEIVKGALSYRQWLKSEGLI